MSSLIRLSPRSFSSLPSALDLPSFLHSALSEAHSLLASIPSTFHHDPKPHPSPPASATVQLSTGTRTPDSHPNPEEGAKKRDEFWVCRRSIHVDASREGTASCDEFRKGLRENHSENEMEYTPSISGVERLAQWPVETEVEGGWTGVDMHVNLITHTFQPTFLISPRSFISLVISADLPDGRGFVTVQIPLTRHPADSMPADLSQKIISSVPQNTIFAAYASVEQVVVLPSGELEWTMATTSDAGGSIPQWLQRSWTMGGVPRAVVGDVGLFIGWTGRRRRSYYASD